MAVLYCGGPVVTRIEYWIGRVVPRAVSKFFVGLFYLTIYTSAAASGLAFGLVFYLSAVGITRI